ARRGHRRQTRDVDSCGRPASVVCRRLRVVCCRPLRQQLVCASRRRRRGATMGMGAQAGHTNAGAHASDAPGVFDDVYMAFADRPVLRGLSCRFPAAKISVILGGSGSGKTTVLRLIGGLVHPQRGRILVAGEDVSQLSETEMYGVRAKLGMMFQGGALLDSL